MTTPTPLPHAVAIQMCSDFDEASQTCGDPNHSPVSCTCLKLAMTWRTMQRDLAAAQEALSAKDAELASVKADADRWRIASISDRVTLSFKHESGEWEHRLFGHRASNLIDSLHAKSANPKDAP